MLHAIVSLKINHWNASKYQRFKVTSVSYNEFYITIYKGRENVDLFIKTKIKDQNFSSRPRPKVSRLHLCLNITFSVDTKPETENVHADFDARRQQMEHTCLLMLTHYRCKAYMYDVVSGRLGVIGLLEWAENDRFNSVTTMTVCSWRRSCRRPTTAVMLLG